MKRTPIASIYAAIFILLTTVAFAQVAISPSNPQDTDNLVCGGVDASNHIFKWYLDGTEKASGTFLSNSQTSAGQVWTCKVFNPPTRYTGVTLKEEASVTIQALPPPPLIPNVAPTADFSSDAPKNEGVQISFTDSSSDSDGTIVARTWVFGDGFNSSILNPTHTYIQNGNYSVTLYVRDNSGTWSSVTKNVLINDLSPVVNFSYSPLNIDEGVTVSFTSLVTSYDPISSYFWKLGGGATSPSQNPGRQYDNGTYVVNLTVTDDDGSVSSAAKTIVVNDRGPFANFTASTYVAAVNQPIFFSSTSTSYPDPIVRYRWTFTGSYNDGPANTSFAYTTPGNKTLYLLVIDSDGSWSQSLPVNIEVRSANLFGTINDTNTGLPISGANISFYDNSTCVLDEITLQETGTCALNPKQNPDTVTDANGNYAVYLPPGLYHMIVQHSRQADRNLFVNNTPKKHDTELKEGPGGINFEGHIIYGGRYRDGNKYIIGDNMTFVMFGVNNAAQDATVTYLVERHVAGVDNGANGPWVLNGSFSDSSKTLTVPANGNKVSKIFNFIIPPSLSMPGRYDIHVLVNNSGTLEKWHKIGNFFILGVDANNRTAPELKLVQGPEYFDLTDGNVNKGQYVNQTFNASFRVKISPQPETINGILFSITTISNNPCNVANEGDEVTILAPGAKINFSGSTTNNVMKINVTNARTTSGCYLISDFKYLVSDKFKINVSVKERYYGALSPIKQVNVTNWATEQQARDIYYDIVENNLIRPTNKSVNFTGFYAGDRNPLVGAGGYGAVNQYNIVRSHSTPSYYNLQTDLFDTTWGFEYRSAQDGYDAGSFNYPTGSPAPCQNEPEVNGIGATNCERDALTTRWQAITTPHYILVIDPMTKKEVAQKVILFGDYMVSQGQSP